MEGIDSQGDFDAIRQAAGAVTPWTVCMQFIFLETLSPELMVFNPMGIILTYLRGDRALVTGG